MQNNQNCNNQFVSQQATEPEAENVSTFVSQMQEIGYPGSHTEEMCHQQTDEPELEFDGEAENRIIASNKKMLESLKQRSRGNVGIEQTQPSAVEEELDVDKGVLIELVR